MRPQRAVASFDSATGMLRALSRFLHGRDVPALGSAPSVAEPALAAAFGSANRLPGAAKERLYAWSGWSEALPQRRVPSIRSEDIAAWVVGHYPRRRYPAVLIGSANGAAIHLAAALGVPWLPQTVLLPVRQHGVDPDEPAADMAAMAETGQRLLAANPEWQLHHLHDANQDRLMIRHMTYFRVKWRTLAAAYARFLRDHLEPGGVVVVVDCSLTWPVTVVGDRHVFQHGAVGGAEIAEYAHGSPRVAAFLERRGSRHRRWTAPHPDAQAPEAEWGHPPELTADVHSFADRHGYRLQRLRFAHPETLSPVVADLHREWHAGRGLPADRLLVETFLLIQPWWTLRSGSVPFWLTFSTEPALGSVTSYLDGREPFDEIRALVFSHGVESVGVAPLEQWRHLVGRARKVGTLVGVDERAYPRDFASFVRAHRELAAIRTRYPMPLPLDYTTVDGFLSDHTGADLRWERLR
jgi:hypothetical protein